MARKREGEDLKWQIDERNGVKYVYTSTSTMVGGKKRTVSEYLGRLDEAGNLVPKKKGKTKAEKEKAAKEKDIVLLEGLSSKEYGAVYFLDLLQKKVGLGDDLYKSFGQSGTTILAMAEAMAMAQSNVFLDIEAEFERTFLRQYYNLDSSMDSGSISKFVNRIGQSTANVDLFYEYRFGRCEGVVSFDTTTNGTYSDMDGLAEWLACNKDNENLKQVKTGLATDMRGVPLAMHHYPATLSDLDTVRSLLSDVERYGKRDSCIFAMDRGFVSAGNLKYMCDQNLQFVAPAPIVSKELKSLLTRMKQDHVGTPKVFDEHAYKVWEVDLGLARYGDLTTASGEQLYRLTVEGDPDHQTEGKLKAFVVFDSKKYSDEVQSYELMITDLLERAKTIDSPRPVDVFKKMAGKAFKYFDVRADGRKVIVERKKKSATFKENRAGMFIMLTSEGMDWETMMTAYDSRRLVEQGFDFEKSTDKRFRTSDKISMEGREFVRFIALILRCEIAALFRENKLDTKFTVDGALASLNSIMALTSGKWSRVDNVTKAHRNLYEVCGFDVPKQVLKGQLSYDIEAVAGQEE